MRLKYINFLLLLIRPNVNGCDDSFITKATDKEISLVSPPASQSYKNGERDASFHFSHVLKQDSTQDEVFKIVVEPQIDQIITGHNWLLFAYGVTNAGKTYTMSGTKEYI